MDTLYERCAGLDVHKQTVVACVRRAEGCTVHHELLTFATTTEGLMMLLRWLIAAGCTHVALEATGVYWKPVWNILSDGPFELVLANARQIKNVPGRKSDVEDATWISNILAFGFVPASFVPDPPIQELRALLRTRKQLIQERTRHTQRIQKTLEEANIKLESKIDDILGLSGRRMIEAMIKGVNDPAELARLADRRIKASQKDLREALHGRVTDNHRFLLSVHLGQYDSLEASIKQIDRKVDALIQQIDASNKAQPSDEADAEQDAKSVSFLALIALLCTMPGVGPLTARGILSEIGCDMTRFPTAGHLVSWAGLCPGLNESAGKRKSSRLRKGNRWLKTTMVQCARSAVQKKGSYYQAQHQRIMSKHGDKKAVCAVAASMLTGVYHMLKNGTAYQELGGNHFDRRSPATKAKQLVSRLTKLGYEVQIKPLAQAA